MPEVAYTIHFGHMLDLYTVILEHLLPLLKIPWSPAQSLPKSLKSLSRYKNPFPELVEKTAIWNRGFIRQEGRSYQAR